MYKIFLFVVLAAATSASADYQCRKVFAEGCRRSYTSISARESFVRIAKGRLSVAVCLPLGYFERHALALTRAEHSVFLTLFFGKVQAAGPLVGSINRKFEDLTGGQSVIVGDPEGSNSYRLNPELVSEE